MSDALAIAVTPDEARFLDDAQRRIARLAQAVAAIPPKGYFDIGSKWGAQFDPIYAEMQALMNEGYSVLAHGGEARSIFTSAMRDLNNLVGHAQNAEEGALEALTKALSANPITMLRWWVDTTSSLASAAGEGTAAYAAQAGGALLDSVKTLFGSPWAWVALAGVGYLGLRGARR